MDRKQAQEEIMNIKSNAILCELPTSFGKSKIGIDLALRDTPKSILIVRTHINAYKQLERGVY